MRAAVNAFALLSVALALPVAPAAAEDSARSQGSGQEGADRWVPSVSLIGGVTIEEWSAAVESQVCRGCTLPSPQQEPLRESASGRDRDVTPYVGGSFELMSPELSLPASPRFFVGAEIMGTFGAERKLAQEGEPGTITTPFPDAPGNEIQPWGEESALGQGSEAIARFDTPSYGAYAGIAFPFELFGRPVRFKPAFAWIRYDVELEGSVVAAECVDSGFPQPDTLCNDEGVFAVPNPNPPPPNIPGLIEGKLREIRLDGSGRVTHDGVGPGLDIEMDTGRFGPLGSSLFIGARAYYILGDRDVEFVASQQYPALSTSDGRVLPPADTSARWSYEFDPWMYRVGVGFRLQWLGSAD